MSDWPRIGVLHDGTYVLVRESGDLIRDASGEPIGWRTWRDADRFRNNLASGRRTKIKPVRGGL